MTKEEAIQIIDSLDPAVMIKTTASNKQIREAIDMAVGALSQPFLPSNLDWAANTFNREDAARMWDYEGKTEGEIVEAAFKAGAEWMAGQGETHETEIVSRVTGNGLLPAVTCLVNKSYKEGDKVVAQIRKK